MKSYHRFRSELWLLALGLTLVPAAGVRAEETAKPKSVAKKAAKADPLAFWFDPRRAHPAAAAELVLAHDPFTIVALRAKGLENYVWNEVGVPDEVPALNQEWLDAAGTRDGKPLPDFRGRAPDEIKQVEKDFYSLYTQALVFANTVPASVFAKSAKENQFVTFGHMYTETWKYRGKVLHVTGRLRSLLRYDAPGAAQAQGIRYTYEGWIALPKIGAHPLCVIFPILPDDLVPAEKMDRPVEFDGYLIFLYRYRSGKGDLNTPFLIGPTVSLKDHSPPVEEKSTPMISASLLYAFVGFVGVVVLLVIGLNWWFHRGDRRVREHLARLRAEKSLNMFENEDPPAS